MFASAGRSFYRVIDRSHDRNDSGHIMPSRPAIPTLLVLACLLPLTAIAQERSEIPREDGARVPINIFRPGGASCSALALLSPGAGGDENGLPYLADALSRD